MNNSRGRRRRRRFATSNANSSSEGNRPRQARYTARTRIWSSICPAANEPDVKVGRPPRASSARRAQSEARSCPTRRRCSASRLRASSDAEQLVRRVELVHAGDEVLGSSIFKALRIRRATQNGEIERRHDVGWSGRVHGGYELVAGGPPFDRWSTRLPTDGGEARWLSSVARLRTVRTGSATSRSGAVAGSAVRTSGGGCGGGASGAVGCTGSAGASAFVPVAAVTASWSRAIDAAHLRSICLVPFDRGHPLLGRDGNPLAVQGVRRKRQQRNEALSSRHIVIQTVKHAVNVTRLTQHCTASSPAARPIDRRNAFDHDDAGTYTIEVQSGDDVGLGTLDVDLEHVDSRDVVLGEQRREGADLTGCDSHDLAGVGAVPAAVASSTVAHPGRRDVERRLYLARADRRRRG